MNEILNPWDAIKDVEYVNFDKEKNGNIIEIQPIENNPTMGTDKYGRIQFEFPVIDLYDEVPTVKAFTTASNRLMKKLKEHIPVEGKKFVIQRFGEGLETDYAVVIKTEQAELPTEEKKEKKK